jgi:hypothetical protein
MLMAIISLALIGGLAIYCFTKAFGVVFLGSPRSNSHIATSEVTKSMLFPQFCIGILMFLIGLFPLLFLKPITAILSVQFQLTLDPSWLSITNSLSMIGRMGCVLIGIFLIFYFIRNRVMKTRLVREGPTWGCGYTAGTAKQQYTGTSYADAVAGLAEPVLRTQREDEPILEEEIFPGKRTFATHPTDRFPHADIEKTGTPANG